jgi:Zn-dependent metalloprotease
LETGVPAQAAARLDPEAAADAFIHAPESADYLHRGPHEDFVRLPSTAGTGGLVSVPYLRTYHGVPVEFGDVVVLVDRTGRILSAGVAPGAPIRAQHVPRLPRARAALAAIRARELLSRAQRVKPVGAAQLRVLAGAQPKLAWRVEVIGRRPSGSPTGFIVFVDAATGKIVDVDETSRTADSHGYYNGDVAIDTGRLGAAYAMLDPTRPDLRCGEVDFAADDADFQVLTGASAVWGDGTMTDKPTQCVDIMYAAQQEWKMLGAWLNRRGLDGRGHGLPMALGLPDANAFFTNIPGFGPISAFGHTYADDTRPLTDMSVVAHEVGHFVFYTTPGSQGDPDDNEMGGLNEGTADILAALTTAYANNPKVPLTWQVGWQADFFGTGRPMRNFYHPSLLGAPDCYSAAIPDTEVHAAGGPLTHWFYLLAEGSHPTNGNPRSPTCDGSTITPLNIRLAGEIWYGALLLKTSAWRYADARAATLVVAKALFPGRCTEFNKIAAAWSAIDVGRGPNDPTCGVLPVTGNRVAPSLAAAGLAALILGLLVVCVERVRRRVA